MDATWIITAFVVIGELMERLGQRRDGRARVSTAEILTIAVISARYVSRHYERAVQMLLARPDRRRARQSSSASARRWDGRESGGVGRSVRYGRRNAVIIDRLPVLALIRRRVRTRRCRKAPGRTPDR